MLFYRYKKANLVLQDLFQKPLSQVNAAPLAQSSILPPSHRESRGKASLLSSLVTSMCLTALEVTNAPIHDVLLLHC